MHSPLFNTAFPDFRETLLIKNTHPEADVEKGAWPVPRNRVGVCFRVPSPAWRSVVVKTDSSVDRSLKFISASQGGNILESARAPPDCLASARSFPRLGFSDHEINAGKHDDFPQMELEMPRPKPQESIYRHSFWAWLDNLDEYALVDGQYVGSE